jgi:hypothetical protein
VHSGYEASGVNYTFGSLKGLLETAKAMLFDDYRDPDALELLEEWKPVQQATETVVPLSAIAGRRQAATVSQD